mmetsp:Transcript_83297/g.165369  ORF Transcript_83297/g.165369 Transcript_83297/m.165369 type:complete len:300 (+) Transcript_83297:56-955(+)
MASPVDVAPVVPCGNCCAIVPQDMNYVLERFGKYHGVLDAGFHCLGLDCCGLVFQLRGVSNRVVEHKISVPARMSVRQEGGLFVKVNIVVQLSVIQDAIQDAVYRFSETGAQVESIVTSQVQSLLQRGVARSKLPEHIQAKLNQELHWAGYKADKVLCSSIVYASREVADADNEIAKERNRVKYEKEVAEAAKVNVVKGAEANADAAHLAGQGIARQRRAIVDGFRESLDLTGSEAGDMERITELLMISQYFETLRDIAGTHKADVVWLPSNAVAAPVQQELPSPKELPPRQKQPTDWI